MEVSDSTKNLTKSLPAVTVSIKARVVVVSGPRGKITKDLSHLNVDMRCMTQKDAKTGKLTNVIRFRMWFGSYKLKCQVKTVHTLISNMVNGVREVSYSPFLPIQSPIPQCSSLS